MQKVLKTYSVFSLRQFLKVASLLFLLISLRCNSQTKSSVYPNPTMEIDKGNFHLLFEKPGGVFTDFEKNNDTDKVTYSSIKRYRSVKEAKTLTKKTGEININWKNDLEDYHLNSYLTYVQFDTLKEYTSFVGHGHGYRIEPGQLRLTMKNLDAKFLPFYGSRINLVNPSCTEDHVACKFWVDNYKSPIKVGRGKNSGELRFTNISYLDFKGLSLLSDDDSSFVSNNLINLQYLKNYKKNLHLSVNISDGTPYIDSIEVRYKKTITFKSNRTKSITFGNMTFYGDSIQIDSLRLKFNRESLEYSFFNVRIYGKELFFNDGIYIHAKLDGPLSIGAIKGVTAYSAKGIKVDNSQLEKVSFYCSLVTFRDKKDEQNFTEFKNGKIGMTARILSKKETEGSIGVEGTDAIVSSYDSEKEEKTTVTITVNRILMDFYGGNGNIGGHGEFLLKNVSFKTESVLKMKEIAKDFLQFSKNIDYSITSSVNDVKGIIGIENNKFFASATVPYAEGNFHINEYRDYYDQSLHFIAEGTRQVCKNIVVVSAVGSAFGFHVPPWKQGCMWVAEKFEYLSYIRIRIRLHIEEFNKKVDIANTCFLLRDGKTHVGGGYIDKIDMEKFKFFLTPELPQERYIPDVALKAFDKFQAQFGLETEVVNLVPRLVSLISKTDNIVFGKNRDNRIGIFRFCVFKNCEDFTRNCNGDIRDKVDHFITVGSKVINNFMDKAGQPIKSPGKGK